MISDPHTAAAGMGRTTPPGMRALWSAVLAAALAVAGCGGGSSGGGAPPPAPAPARTYGATLTGLEITRPADGLEMTVSGLPAEGAELTVRGAPGAQARAALGGARETAAGVMPFSRACSGKRSVNSLPLPSPSLLAEILPP